MSANLSKPDFAATINRFRQIASASIDARLTEGEVTADDALLDLCADALHLLAHAQKARDKRKTLNWVYVADAAESKRLQAEDHRLYEEIVDEEASAKPQMFRIRKLKAHTPAGIYAKAAVVRASASGAAVLARSLAEDLLACDELRKALWPAGKSN